MVLKPEQLHFQPLKLSGVHYQVAAGNAESEFCIHTHMYMYISIHTYRSYGDSNNRQQPLSMFYELGHNIKNSWSSHCDAAEMNPTRNQEVASSIPGFAQQVKDLARP